MWNGQDDAAVPREEEWKRPALGASRTDGHEEARVIGWNACRLIKFWYGPGGIRRLKGYGPSELRSTRSERKQQQVVGLPIRIQDET